MSLTGNHVYTVGEMGIFDCRDDNIGELISLREIGANVEKKMRLILSRRITERMVFAC